MPSTLRTSVTRLLRSSCFSISSLLTSMPKCNAASTNASPASGGGRGASASAAGTGCGCWSRDTRRDCPKSAKALVGGEAAGPAARRLTLARAPVVPRAPASLRVGALSVTLASWSCDCGSTASPQSAVASLFSSFTSLGFSPTPRCLLNSSSVSLVKVFSSFFRIRLLRSPLPNESLKSSAVVMPTCSSLCITLIKVFSDHDGLACSSRTRSTVSCACWLPAAPPEDDEDGSEACGSIFVARVQQQQS
mmetsp:Transcript_71238/g.170596  ORF Transcript_71238/g.170596 Transcript_71238/m.170596 type:complete len:249 (+) Transcript_71238:3012-3758(+)